MVTRIVFTLEFQPPHKSVTNGGSSFRRSWIRLGEAQLRCFGRDQLGVWHERGPEEAQGNHGNPQSRASGCRKETRARRASENVANAA